MNDDFMPNVIGQKRLKGQLSIFAESFRQKGVAPFLFFEGPRGSGKTYLTREFCKELVDRQGRPRPMIEVPASEASNMASFLNIWYPKMRDDNAVLFFDEAHKLHNSVQNGLLIVCDKKKDPRRQYRFEDPEMGERTIDFDFRNYCMFFASTDKQKLLGPLKDRFTPLVIGEYSKDDLWEIFEMSLHDCEVSPNIRDDIAAIFRGHPRSCVELADNLDHYASARQVKYINGAQWDDFREIMGIHDYGLNEIELRIIRILGTFGPQALQDLAAKTELSKGVIQQEFEMHLKKQNLITVHQKRQLTGDGHKLFRKVFA